MTLWFRGKGPPHHNCCVVGCHNNYRHLQDWLDSYCEEHKIKHGIGKCVCPPPFTLFPFPTERRNPERRAAWTNSVNRATASGELWQPTVSSRVCSEHFVDKKPTDKNPDPNIKMGYIISGRSKRIIKASEKALSSEKRPPRKALMYSRLPRKYSSPSIETKSETKRQAKGTSVGATRNKTPTPTKKAKQTSNVALPANSQKTIKSEPVVQGTLKIESVPLSYEDHSYTVTLEDLQTDFRCKCKGVCACPTGCSRQVDIIELLKSKIQSLENENEELKSEKSKFQYSCKSHGTAATAQCGTCVKLKGLLSQHYRFAHATRLKVVQTGQYRTSKRRSRFKKIPMSYLRRKFRKNNTKTTLKRRIQEDKTVSKISVPVDIKTEVTPPNSTKVPKVTPVSLIKNKAIEVECLKQGNNFKCSGCDLVSPHRDNIEWHIDHVHKAQVRCGICKSLFRNKVSCQEHVSNVHKNPKATINPKSSNSSGDGLQFVDGQRKTTSLSAENATFKCSKCNFVSRRMAEVELHITLTHQDRFACSACNATFSTKPACHDHIVKEHEKSTSNNKPPTKNADAPLWITQLFASGKKRFVCSICNAIFYDKRLCLAHIVNRHKKSTATNEAPTTNATNCETGSRNFADSDSTQGDVSQRGVRILPKPTNQSQINSKTLQQNPNLLIMVENKPTLLLLHDKQTTAEGLNATQSEILLHDKQTPAKGLNATQNYIYINSYTTLNSGLFQCNICKMIFAAKSHVERHITKQHGNCTKLSVGNDDAFSNATDVVNNWFKRRTTALLPKLNPRFNRYSLLSSLYGCKVCKKILNNRDQLSIHLRDKHAMRPVYRQNYQVLANDKAVIGEFLKPEDILQKEQPRVVCTICSTEFPDSESLFDHMNIHSGATPFLCSTCGKAYPTETQRNSHERVHVVRAKCKVCSKTFPGEYLLKRHMLKHTGEKTYPGQKLFYCDQCGKTLKSAASVRGHVRVHHGGHKPYKCPQCDYRCGYKSGIKVHMIQRHTNERPYLCSYCHCTFKTISSVKSHERRHKKEYRYTCNLCGKRFIRSSDLKQHLVTHSGVRRYSCGLCESAYKWRGAVSQHIKHRHPDVPVEERSNFVVELPVGQQAPSVQRKKKSQTETRQDRDQETFAQTSTDHSIASQFENRQELDQEQFRQTSYNHPGASQFLSSNIYGFDLY